MTFPKGAMVILNAWSVHHDPERYPRVGSPAGLQPGPLPRHDTARVRLRQLARPPEARPLWLRHRPPHLPGNPSGERTLWLARILWAFYIKPKVDAATGKSIPIDVDPVTGYADGFVSQCLPFDVDVKVRSEKRWETIFRDELVRAFE